MAGGPAFALYDLDSGIRRDERLYRFTRPSVLNLL